MFGPMHAARMVKKNKAAKRSASCRASTGDGGERKYSDWQRERTERVERLKRLRSASLASERPSVADQLSLREDFDAVCDQVEKNNRRKSSVGNASLASLSPSSVPSRSGSVRSGLGRSGSINSALDHSDTLEIIGGGNKRGAKRNRLKRTEDTSAADGCCGGQCVIL